MSETTQPMEEQEKQGYSSLSLGEQLRLKRKERGMRIDDVAHHLKLDPALLLAFEEDREPPNSLPDVYCKGFLRNYARYLGIEIRPGMIKACKSSDLTIDQGEKRTGYRHNPLWAVIAVAALVVVAWLVQRDDIVPDQIVDGTSPASKVESKTVPDQANPTEPAASVDAGTSGDKAVDSIVAESEAEALTETDESGAVVEPEANGEESSDSTDSGEMQESTAGGEPSGDLSQPVAQPEVVEPTRGVVTIRYINSSWTEVTDGLGRVLVKRSLDAGAIEDFEGPLPLKVNLGNAIGVRLKFNGEPFDHLNYIDDNNIARFTLGGRE